jgi:hypothetical protein
MARKLDPTHAPHSVVRSYRRREPLGELPQDAVAAVVPVVVVDALELVQVDEEHGQHGPAALEPVPEQRSVGRPVR